MNSYPVRVDVLLKPVGTPMVEVSCGGESKILRLFSTETWTSFKFDQTAGPLQLSVEHRERAFDDGVTAVEIKSVKINDIESPKILYQGLYYPIGMPARRTTYIDFNGVWVLDFSVPVYTWLHNTLGLGWIYD